MTITVNDTVSMGAAPGASDNRPVAHRSSQISAGPQYVADVLGRFGAEPAVDPATRHRSYSATTEPPGNGRRAARAVAAANGCWRDRNLHDRRFVMPDSSESLAQTCRAPVVLLSNPA